MHGFRGRMLSFLVIVALLVPLTPPPPPAQAAAPPPLDTEYTPPTAELAGANRVETAVRVAEDGWASSDYVVIATSANFPDALAGAPLAYALSAPLLLTPPTSLAPAVAAEISRLGATRAVVLGGEQALSAAVIDGLVAAGIARGNVERIAGTSRYETARDIALRLQQVAGPAPGVVVASGRTYPDALAIAGFAARSGRPIVLTAPSALPDATRAALASIVSTDTLIVGGPAAVSNEVADELPDPVRIGGENRYETAALIAEHAFRSGVMTYDEVLVATGERFPDALAAGPYAAKRASTLILTRSQSLPAATEDFVRAHTSSTQRIVFLGSSAAISDAVRAAVMEAATTRIAENVYVTDAATENALVDASPEELLFGEQTALLEVLREDDILIGEPSAAAPEGYLRRVVEVSEQGTQVSVETTGVVIEELIEDGSIDVAQVVTPDEIVWDEVVADGVTVEHAEAASPSALIGGMQAQSVRATFGEFKVSLDDVAVGGAKLNGSLSVSPSYDFHVHASNFKITDARFATTITERASLTLSGPPLKREIELYRFRPPSVKAMVGPVPVWISATFKLFAGVDASGSVDLRVGVEQGVSITSGIEYRSGSWGPVAEFRPTFKVITPSASSDVTVELYGGAKAELKLYDLAGPYGEVKPLVECTFTIGGDPWWRAKRAIDLTAGFVAEVDVGTGWLKWTWTLVEVSRTWRVAEASLGQSTSSYVPPPGDDDPPDTSLITFPDANLEAVVRDALDKPTGDITVADMQRLEVLDARYSGISDLSGLQHAANLSSLYLGNVTCDPVPYNRLSDISPLAGLTNLSSLDLARNQISDITPLTGLTNLESLHLHENQIFDITPLAGLTNLSSLDLSWNQISDITPLAGLTNLSSLGLGSNQVSDISPLTRLTTLQSLDLHTNPISDISALSGLWNLEMLVLILNQISDITPLTGLTNLEVLYLGHNQISDITPLTGLTNLRWLNLDANQISDISALVANTSLGVGDYIEIRRNNLDLTEGSAASNDIATLQARGVQVSY